MNEYLQFLETKKKSITESGFDTNALNPLLKDFQSHIVRIALKKGRYAIFADCGLGKTFMQLEWAYRVMEHTNKPVLILAPLAVSAQTIQEGQKFGIEVFEYVPEMYSMDMPTGIYITNYEQIDNILNVDDFVGVVLDESSILKNFEGATKELIINVFKDTPYKLACTATPSPNDPMELGNHAEFLNIMSRNEMLSMYFIHDGGETSKWRLKGHCEDMFWQFVSQWAMMLSSPNDIGFYGNDYVLPQLNYIEKQIKTAKKNNGFLFNDEAISATEFNSELRLTKLDRLSEVINIVNSSTENFIIWIKQNEEGEYLRKMIPDAIEGNYIRVGTSVLLINFVNYVFRPFCHVF